MIKATRAWKAINNFYHQEDKKYLYWGLVFASLQGLAITRNFVIHYQTFYWYCDFAPAVFATLFFLKNNQAIRGFLSIGLFAQALYAISFLSKLVFNVPLFGIPFDAYGPLNIFTTLVLHLSTSAAFLATYNVRPQKISLVYSLFFLVLIYTAVLLFTSPTLSFNADYNFIYYNQTISPYVKFYTALWVPLAFFAVVIPTYWFQLVIYKLRKKPDPAQSGDELVLST